MGTFTAASQHVSNVVLWCLAAATMSACARDVTPESLDGGIASVSTDGGDDRDASDASPPPCDPGRTLCDGLCTDLDTDPTNCGACDRTCPGAPAHGTASCEQGACTIGCDTGYVFTAGACVDPCAQSNGGCGEHAICGRDATGATCTCEPGFVGDGHSCMDVAGNLEGLRWELPCTSAHDGHGCDSLSAPVVTSTTCSGTAGVTYDVVLRFRGVVEQRTYVGGTQSAYWYVGGNAPDRSDPYNIYGLTISSPPQQYYLNAGASYQGACWPVDYTETVQIAAGATVTLTADDVEGTSIINVGTDGNPIVAPGVPPAPAAYDGQFLQMDVVSVTPR